MRKLFARVDAEELACGVALALIIAVLMYISFQVMDNQTRETFKDNHSSVYENRD